MCDVLLEISGSSSNKLNHILAAVFRRKSVPQGLFKARREFNNSKLIAGKRKKKKEKNNKKGNGNSMGTLHMFLETRKAWVETAT